MPTANAYSARVREERWLADQELQHQAQREAGEREAVATRNQRRAEAEQREAADREQAAAAKEQRREDKRSGAKRFRPALLAAATLALLLLVGGGTAAYVLLSDDGTFERTDAPTSTTPQTTPPSDTGISEAADTDSEPADDGGACAPAEGIAPPNLFPAEGARDAITLEAIGTSCESATRLAKAYFPAETTQGATPGEPVDVQGFACIQTQGSSGSSVECEQGTEQVTFRVGDSTVVPEGFDHCPMYETRDRGVFDGGVQGVGCSEAEDVLDQIVQTDAVVGDWSCRKNDLSVCTSADLGAEIRYRISTLE